jgi:4-hydroxybenzoate polyprenyltransferase
LPVPEPRAQPVPLCVDLDGTLIRGDALWEGVLGLVRDRPFGALGLPLWLGGGRAAFKRRVADASPCVAERLPYREELVAWLKRERLERPVVLCTAADESVARRVASHLGVFDDVLCSDGATNLKGESKAARLVERYGERGFDYVGNDASDLAVWSRARHAYVVGRGPALATRAGRVASVERRFGEDDEAPLGAWLRALRLYQWVKNLLVFVPLLTAHLVAQAEAWFAATVAFAAFGMFASAAYVLNDLLDLHADRAHARKRHRPFAAGALSIAAGVAAIPMLVLAGAALSLLLPAPFALALATYFAVTVAYSLLLKRIAIVDVVTLAALYTLRVVAGTLALGLALSFWLLAFSMFMFLSLALVKRYAELSASTRAPGEAVAGRGYVGSDLPILGSLGAASGYLGVLVLALYINSTASAERYDRPEALWLLCPLLLYWISRTWLITHRGDMHDDPILFAARDRTSHAVALVGIAVVLAAV